MRLRLLPSFHVRQTAHTACARGNVQARGSLLPACAASGHAAAAPPSSVMNSRRLIRSPRRRARATSLAISMPSRQVGKPARSLLPASLHPDPPRHIVLHSCGLRPASCRDVAPPFRALTFSPNCPAPGSSPPRPTLGPTIRPHSPAPAAHDLRKPSHSRGSATVSTTPTASHLFLMSISSPPAPISVRVDGSCFVRAYPSHLSARAKSNAVLRCGLAAASALVCSAAKT